MIAPSPLRGTALTLVDDDPKMVRETLCVAQAAVARATGTGDRDDEHIARLQRLIDECDRHRPLGQDGKHGDLHTPTCGCDDVERPMAGDVTAVGVTGATSDEVECKRCGHLAVEHTQGQFSFYGVCPAKRMAEAVPHPELEGCWAVRDADGFTFGTYGIRADAEGDAQSVNESDTVERGARSIYEDERAVSPIAQHWPDWDHAPSEVRTMYSTRFRRALAASTLGRVAGGWA